MDPDIINPDPYNWNKTNLIWKLWMDEGLMDQDWYRASVHITDKRQISIAKNTINIYCICCCCFPCEQNICSNLTWVDYIFYIIGCVLRAALKGVSFI